MKAMLLALFLVGCEGARGEDCYNNKSCDPGLQCVGIWLMPQAKYHYTCVFPSTLLIYPITPDFSKGVAKDCPPTRTGEPK